MKPNKAICGFGGGLELIGAIVSVYQLQLRLLGVATKRVTALEHLQAAHREAEVLILEVALRFPVELLLSGVGNQIVVIAAKP